MSLFCCPGVVVAAVCVCDRWWVLALLGEVEVLCFGPPAGVVGRFLIKTQLSGSIPVELGWLTRLQQLYVSVVPSVFVCEW